MTSSKQFDVIICATCGKRKKPIGRSAPVEMYGYLCDYECLGYLKEPKPSQFWPGEERA